VNQAIRAGLSGTRATDAFRTPTARMGFESSLPWSKALRLLGQLEDEELVRKLTARK
jgi:hypothetical protein